MFTSFSFFLYIIFSKLYCLIAKFIQVNGVVVSIYRSCDYTLYTVGMCPVLASLSNTIHQLYLAMNSHQLLFSQYNCTSCKKIGKRSILGWFWATGVLKLTLCFVLVSRCDGGLLLVTFCTSIKV